MTYRPTTPDAYPDGTDTEAYPCNECGESVYVPSHETRSGQRHTCRDCLREYLAGEYRTADSHAEALRALDELESHDFLPVEDRNGRLVVTAVLDHQPSTGRELRSITRLVPVANEPLTGRETCPECGYDRCYVNSWRAPGGVERGDTAECVACGGTIAEENSL